MDTPPAGMTNGDGPVRSAESLLAGLRDDTDLAALVERVQRHRLDRVVVLASSVAAWERRDAAGWARVSEWLAAQGVLVAQIGLPPEKAAAGPRRAS